MLHRSQNVFLGFFPLPHQLGHVITMYSARIYFAFSVFFSIKSHVKKCIQLNNYNI